MSCRDLFSRPISQIERNVHPLELVLSVALKGIARLNSVEVTPTTIHGRIYLMPDSPVYESRQKIEAVFCSLCIKLTGMYWQIGQSNPFLDEAFGGNEQPYYEFYATHE